MIVLRRLDLRGVAGDLGSHVPRPDLNLNAPTEAVRLLLDDVRARGDSAVRELTERFDGVDVGEPLVGHGELAAAADRVDSDVMEALRIAHDRILNFHISEVGSDHRVEDHGISVRVVAQPVDRVGVYVPGGLAAYPSTVLMTVLPAKAAGVDDVMVCTPPGPDGSISDVVMAAAFVCGVSEVYRIGGGQAIGAMAYGTETIRPVDVIAGPGNIWVATAKQEVTGQVGIASAFAGPSEIVVISDSSVSPTSSAIDIVLQAEHGPGGRAWLITWDEDHADAVDVAVAQIVDMSPRRDDTMATLVADGWICLVDGPDAAIEVSNAVAPEHLQIMCAGAEAMVDHVRHAGAVFVGEWGSASIGDYVAGPSHVLPTAGTARFAGALSVGDFQKRMHVINVSKAGFDCVKDVVANLATVEGLWAHAASVSERELWAREGLS